MRRDDGAGGCYTIPMGLCYDCGFRALTVALALGLPGDYFPPRGPGGTDQHGELAVVEQAERAEQLTADRDRFSLKVRWVRVCVSSLAARGPVERRAEIGPGKAPPPEQGTIGPDHRHRQVSMSGCRRHHFISASYGTVGTIRQLDIPALGLPSTLSTGGRSGQGGQWWTVVDVWCRERSSPFCRKK